MINGVILSQTHRTCGSFHGISSNFDKNVFPISLKVFPTNSFASLANHES